MAISRSADDSRLPTLSMLVVEDEALVAMTLEDLLTDMGHDVIAMAQTVRQGLAALDDDVLPEFAVLDANLGGESVAPLARRLQAAAIPFVFATGYGEDYVRRLGFTEPVLIKPYRPDQLARAIRQAVLAPRVAAVAAE